MAKPKDKSISVYGNGPIDSFKIYLDVKEKGLPQHGVKGDIFLGTKDMPCLSRWEKGKNRLGERIYLKVITQKDGLGSRILDLTDKDPDFTVITVRVNGNNFIIPFPPDSSFPSVKPKKTKRISVSPEKFPECYGECLTFTIKTFNEEGKSNNEVAQILTEEKVTLRDTESGKILKLINGSRAKDKKFLEFEVLKGTSNLSMECDEFYTSIRIIHPASGEEIKQELKYS